MSGLYPRLAAALLFGLALTSCDSGENNTANVEHDEAAADYERGPHRGRLLRENDFAVELTIFEEGVPPEFRIYAYQGGKQLPPEDVQLTVTLGRLGGDVDRFAFVPEDGYSRGTGVVTEPHSFDVTVVASYAGERHTWKYASYEGRTTIAPDAAAQLGIAVDKAGPAVISQTVGFVGHIELAPGARAEVGVPFQGRVVAVTTNVGDRVARGAVLARIESNETLQTYSVTAPIDGVLLERNTNIGDVTGSGPIFVVGDPGQVMVTFPVYSRDMRRVQPGQSLMVRSFSGDYSEQTEIADFLPLAQAATQTLTARALLPNPDGVWRPGMSVHGAITVAQREVPLAVRTSALQTFRDFTVVFARVGDTYEVRMLELGEQTSEWTEVLGGIEPGQSYVTEGSYIIKADIEKSGATHDH